MERMPDEERILEHGLEIMKNVYDGFVNDFNRTHTAILGLFAAGATISTFILTDWNIQSASFLPIELVFIAIGISSIMFSFWNLQHTTGPFVLPKPGDIDKYKNVGKYESYADYLKVMHADYAECIKYASRQINKRHRRFSNWMMAIFIGLASLLLAKMGFFRLFAVTRSMNYFESVLSGICVAQFVMVLEYQKKVRLEKGNNIWAKAGDVHLEEINKASK